MLSENYITSMKVGYAFKCLCENNKKVYEKQNNGTEQKN